MNTKCIKCNKRPVHIKSRGLCLICVQKFYAERKTNKGKFTNELPISEYKQNRIQYNSEMAFVKSYFTHIFRYEYILNNIFKLTINTRV